MREMRKICLRQINSLVGQLEAKLERKGIGVGVRRMGKDTGRKELLPSESFLVDLKKILGVEDR